MIRYRTRVVAVAACISLVGCAAMEDFASNPDKQKTRQGAGYGAAADAVYLHHRLA